MTSSGTATVTLPADEQILITREFDAPKDLVYKAFTTPALVSRWWTAKRGEMTTCEIDLRVGGKWRYVMQLPDGMEVGFHGEYREIVPNERVVSTEEFEGMPGADSVNTATFTEEGGVLRDLLRRRLLEPRDVQPHIHRDRRRAAYHLPVARQRPQGRARMLHEAWTRPSDSARA